MEISIVFAVLGSLPIIYELGRRFAEVDVRRYELKNTLKELKSKVKDMDKKATEEEDKPGKKRKREVNTCFKQVKRYKESAKSVLRRSQEGQWKLKRISCVPCIQRHQQEGEELVKKCEQLLEKGLTYDAVRTRGEKLLARDQYMGETTRGVMESAFQAIKSGAAQCIGIYGSVGAGKTNLMKYLHNKIYDEAGFQAVYWATAPEVGPDLRSYNIALQKRVADGMWIHDFNENYHSEVTRAGRIMARLREIGSGRAVLFLDDVREEFSAFELLGLPSLGNDSSSDASTITTVANVEKEPAVTESVTETETATYNALNCILVFTTRSKEICYRMGCDRILKIDLLGKHEAKEMFLHEVRGTDDSIRARIEQVAVEVANECAGMPLVINFIAQSMARIKDIREWRNRLNELRGIITSIHQDEETKIVEQLKFGYNCLKDSKVQHCFLDAASLLADNRQVSKERIICKWKKGGLIGMDRRGNFADDQGHTILNQLERICLLQVAPDHQTVTMNKWIWKMAQKVKQLL